MVRKPPTKSTSDHGLPATGAPPPHSSPLCCRNRWYGAGKYPTYVRFSLSRPHSKFPAQRDVVNLLSRRERDDETTGPILALILEDCARLKARTVRVAIPRRPRDVDVETDELTAIFGIALPGSRIVETELLRELVVVSRLQLVRGRPALTRVAMSAKVANGRCYTMILRA